MLARTKHGGPPKGKLYFLHCYDDWALWFSSYLNWEDRVGQRGIGKYKWTWNRRWYEDTSLVRNEIRGHYENYDCGGFINKMSDQSYKHSYEFDSFAIDFYNKKSKEIKPDA